MGYPDDFKMVCSDARMYQQFGNSVVVPVVEHLARAVVECLQRPVDEGYEPHIAALQLPLPLH